MVMIYKYIMSIQQQAQKLLDKLDRKPEKVQAQVQEKQQRFNYWEAGGQMWPQDQKTQSTNYGGALHAQHHLNNRLFRPLAKRCFEVFLNPMDSLS